MTPHRSSRFAFLLISLSLALVGSALSHDKKDWPVPEEARTMTNPVPLTDAALASAKAIFDESCANCHGDTGKGDGPDAAMYSVKPADLSDAHMMSEMTDGEIFYKISEGRKPMPPFKKTLTEEQRWQLVHFVRTFAPKPAPAPAKKVARAKKSAAKKP
ncbi:MAG: c-type cytochrome [Acidobacteria bacterium]|nr:c-type cytochrome [Acidobacteriota bacterium]MBI3661839.1 c-type cytochrome [Acidobacteriota bacterium]